MYDIYIYTYIYSKRQLFMYIGKYTVRPMDANG